MIFNSFEFLHFFAHNFVKRPVRNSSRPTQIREALSERVHTNARGAALLLDQMIDDGVLPEPAGAKSDASPD